MTSIYQTLDMIAEGAVQVHHIFLEENCLWVRSFSSLKVK